jgi:asparagine synthetase B (glutamine-hydrolysing)
MSVSALSVLVSSSPRTTARPLHSLTSYTESGAQPLTNADESIVLAVNGEIYNHRLIRKHLKNPYHFKTHSDCEVIIPLVRPAGPPPDAP